MKIDDFCQRLEDRLATRPSGEGRVELIVQAVHKAFNVHTEEVAIFTLDAEKEVLCFLWPLKLQNSGFVPLTSSDSLAAQTARQNRSFVNNRFASVQHSSIFEHIRLDHQEPGKPAPIQKIISAPLSIEGVVKGVIQVCRKGGDPSAAGPHFSQDELNALTEIAKSIARYL